MQNEDQAESRAWKLATLLLAAAGAVSLALGSNIIENNSKDIERVVGFTTGLNVSVAAITEQLADVRARSSELARKQDKLEDAYHNLNLASDRTALRCGKCEGMFEKLEARIDDLLLTKEVDR